MRISKGIKSTGIIDDGEQDNDKSEAFLSKQIFMKYSLCDQPDTGAGTASVLTQ